MFHLSIQTNLKVPLQALPDSSMKSLILQGLFHLVNQECQEKQWGENQSVFSSPTFLFIETLLFHYTKFGHTLSRNFLFAAPAKLSLINWDHTPKYFLFFSLWWEGELGPCDLQSALKLEIFINFDSLPWLSGTCLPSAARRGHGRPMGAMSHSLISPLYFDSINITLT